MAPSFHIDNAGSCNKVTYRGFIGTKSEAKGGILQWEGEPC